jgi:hypothetical protein
VAAEDAKPHATPWHLNLTVPQTGHCLGSCSVICSRLYAELNILMLANRACMAAVVIAAKPAVAANLHQLRMMSMFCCSALRWTYAGG